ncbi:MAG: DUF1836 domain-containing protein [Eubacterium sp.]|nr:DUF1836 domain-containing protein [Eubacterium sp.]
MDQITTFMDTRLENTKRYPEDKILTKTMINNYTKNHLLPPSVKKKYSKEHLFMLIFIYHLKSMLSISDIQTLLEPVSDSYFSEKEGDKLNLKEIYDRITRMSADRHPDIEADIQKVLDQTDASFDDYALTREAADYLDAFSFIYQLCYDIYVRKQLIEKFIDHYREEHPSRKGKKKKDEKKD